MSTRNKITVCVVVTILVSIWLGWFLFLRGDGGFKRMVTLTGVYAVCKPAGYPFVCFLEAGHEGGLNCHRWDEACK